ncbi:MAG: hypothetical protein KGJ06_06200 [Pseudomonadota bacterium]|nr:hypothetical protein [Pseudomonadota bacterium]
MVATAREEQPDWNESVSGQYLRDFIIQLEDTAHPPLPSTANPRYRHYSENTQKQNDTERLYAEHLIQKLSGKESISRGDVMWAMNDVFAGHPETHEAIPYIVPRFMSMFDISTAYQKGGPAVKAMLASQVEDTVAALNEMEEMTTDQVGYEYLLFSQKLYEAGERRKTTLSDAFYKEALKPLEQLLQQRIETEIEAHGVEQLGDNAKREIISKAKKDFLGMMVKELGFNPAILNERELN